MSGALDERVASVLFSLDSLCWSVFIMLILDDTTNTMPNAGLPICWTVQRKVSVFGTVENR